MLLSVFLQLYSEPGKKKVRGGVSLPELTEKEKKEENLRNALLGILDGMPLQEVGESLGMNKRYLSDAFRRNFGVGVREYKKQCESEPRTKLSYKRKLESISSGLTARRGNPHFISYHTEEQEKWMASICRNAAALNMPYDALEIEVYATALANKNFANKNLPLIESVHKSWKTKFLQRHELKQYSICRIDKRRAAKVSEESRVRQFQKYGNLIQRLVAQGEMPKEVLTDPNELAKYVWNMDETGAGDGKGNQTKIFGKKQHKDLHYKSESKDGDHCPFHATVCMLIRANGELGDFFVLHSDVQEGARHNLKSGLGLPGSFSVLSTKNGSMTKLGFPSFCDFFIKRLPPGYGKNGKATILLLDQVRIFL